MHRAGICRDAGLSESTLWRIIDAHHTPSTVVAAKLARALSVDPGWLIDDSKGWPPVRVEQPEDSDHAPSPIAA